MKILSIDLSELPDESCEIIVGCKPKYICKNNFVQKILIKLFGYKIQNKTVRCKKIHLKAEDYPFKSNGEITFKFNEN